MSLRLAAFAALVVLGTVWLLGQEVGPDVDVASVPRLAVESTASGEALDSAPAAAPSAAPALRGRPEAPSPRPERGSSQGGRRLRETWEGLVYDRVTRQPIAGVTVTIRGGEETPSTTTDGQGLFSLAVFHPVAWYERIDLVHPDYVACGLEEVPTWEHPDGRLPPLPMDRVVARLPGRVVDWQGRPVADARVRVEEAGTCYRSDRGGRFGPVPVGGWGVDWVAWAPGAARSEDSLEIAPDLPDEFLVRLRPHALVEGLVLDEGGRPVAGARVHRHGCPDERSCETDQAGRFRWPLGFDCGARLVAVASGRAGLAWATAGLPLRIELEPMEAGAWRWAFAPRQAPSPPPDASVKPTPLVTLRLCVVDPAGRPLPWAEVALSAPAFHARRYVDRRGRWTARVPSGRPVEVCVSHPAGAPSKQTLSFGAGRAHDLRVALPPRPPPAPQEPSTPEEEPPPETCIRGVVHDAEGRPRHGVCVEAPPFDGGYSDEWGRWTVRGGRPGTKTRLYVAANGWVPFEAEGVFGGPEVELGLPARSALRIRLQGPAVPAAAPEVRLWAPPDHEPDLLDLCPERVFQDTHGYRVDCPVGTWTVAFRLRPGDWALYPDVRVEAGRESVLTYDLPRLGRLRVWVHDPHGVPVDDACVYVAATGAEIGWTEEDGLLEVEAWDAGETIPAGRVRLRVESWDHVPVLTRPVDLRRDEIVHVRLVPGVRVKGAIRNTAGKPVYALVGLVLAGGQPAGLVSQSHSGRFELDTPVLPGAVRLRILHDGFPPCDRVVQVPAGREEVEVELRVP